MKNKKIALVAMFTIIVIFVMFLNNNIYASYEVTSTTFHRSDGRCVCDYCGATFTNSTLEKCPGCGLKFKPDSTTFHRSDGRCVCDFCGTTFTNSLSTSCPGCGVSFSNTSSSETNSNNASASNNNRNGNGISGAGVPTSEQEAYRQVYGGGTTTAIADNQNSNGTINNGASGSGGSSYTQGQSGSAGTTPTTNYSQNSNGTISNSGSSTATSGTTSNNSNGSSGIGTTSTTSSSEGTIRTSSVNRSSSSSGSNGDSGTYSSRIDANDYKTSPSLDPSGDVMNLTKRILGVINAVGVIILVATIALLGIKYITSSLEERADYKKSMIPILIGAFLLFSVSTIINVVYRIMSN